MRAGDIAARDRLRRRMGAAMREQLRQHMRVRAFRRDAALQRDRLVDLRAPRARDEHAMRAMVQDQAHRGIARLEQRAPRVSAQAGDQRGIGRRARSSRPEARRARGRTTPRRDPARAGTCVSDPSSVSALRRPIAHSACGRQNATRWLHDEVVTVSNANGRRPGNARSRMPPRAVTTDVDCSVRSISAGSSGSRTNSAIAPNVPRLHCASGSASCSQISSKASAIHSP